MRRILDEFNHQCDDSGISLGSTGQRLHQQLAEFFDNFGSHVFRRPAKVEALRWQDRDSPTTGRTHLDWKAVGRPRAARHCSVGTPTIAELATSLTNRRAHQVRWPLACARRDAERVCIVSSYCALRGQQGDLQERIQQQHKRLLRQGESPQARHLTYIRVLNIYAVLNT